MSTLLGGCTINISCIEFLFFLPYFCWLPQGQSILFKTWIYAYVVSASSIQGNSNLFESMSVGLNVQHRKMIQFMSVAVQVNMLIPILFHESYKQRNLEYLCYDCHPSIIADFAAASSNASFGSSVP